MLVGNLLINLFFGLAAFIIVFTASYGQNLLFTSFIRSGIAFFLSFLIAFVFRYLLALASKDKVEENIIDNDGEDRGIDEIEDPNLLESNEMELNEEDIYKASQYVKDLLDDEEV